MAELLDEKVVNSRAFNSVDLQAFIKVIILFILYNLMCFGFC